MRHFFILFFIGIGTFLFAQQAPQFSTYMLNPYAYNPAAAGMQQTLLTTIVYRKQWNDLPGAPETAHANVHCPLGFIPFGAGIQVETDGLGAHQVNKAALSLSAQRFLGSKSRLSLGLSLGYLQYRLDGSLLRAPQGQYEANVFLHNDDFLPEENAQAATPYVEVGILLDAGKFKIGFSALPVYAPALQFSEKNGINYTLRQHFVAQANYTIEVGEQHQFVPSVLVKSDGIQTQAEISGIFAFRGNILLGTSFRGVGASSRDAVVLLLGGKISPKTTVAYTFDIPLSPLKAAHRGSHELLLRYDLGRTLGKGNLPPLVYNPRFY